MAVSTVIHIQTPTYITEGTMCRCWAYFSSDLLNMATPDSLDASVTYTDLIPAGVTPASGAAIYIDKVTPIIYGYQEKNSGRFFVGKWVGAGTSGAYVDLGEVFESDQHPERKQFFFHDESMWITANDHIRLLGNMLPKAGGPNCSYPPSSIYRQFSCGIQYHFDV
jgi:hypothetical protein